MDLLDDLQWRYACKKMNGQKISDDQLSIILGAIRLAPTSMGLQAFKILIIKDQELKNKIVEQAAPNQSMIPGCSHLLVFAAYTKLTENDINSYLNHMVNSRDMAESSIERLKNIFMDILRMPEDRLKEWTIRQTYIAMAYASIAAANLKIDATPVEGYSGEKLDKILNLSDQNLIPVTMLPLGYRDEEDQLATLPKVRKNFEELFVFC